MKIQPVGAEPFHVDRHHKSNSCMCHTGMNIYILLTVKQPLQPLTASNYILI